MANLYEQIDSNKQRSYILVFIVLAFVVGVVGLYSYAVRGDFILPIIAAIFSVPTTLIGYYSGDKIALAVNKARPVTKELMPEIYNIVENLSITAGMPKPKLYYIDSPALNAFATGRDPEHASIAITRGLVEKLDRSELEGVLAHELSHVRNYDIRYATIVAIFVGFLTILSDFVFRSFLWGGMGGRGNNENRNNGQLGVILAIFGVVLLIISPIVAKIIQLAISRQREFLADSSGSLLTRYPEGLASALEKISGHSSVETAAQSTAHLFIASPLRGKSLAKLFATHPPIEERVKRLRNL